MHRLRALVPLTFRSGGESLPISDSSNETPRTLCFQASTLFLRDCWQYLTSDEHGNERLHLVTGSITAQNVHVLSRMQILPLENQSPAYVSLNRAASHFTILTLDDNDHKVLGSFHSHISHGALSTYPSGTDIKNQARFERLGYPALAGIFSLDGYIRFFTIDQPFSLDIYGSGARICYAFPNMILLHLEQCEVR